MKKGFTLIEILVAATIISVLSVVGVASYTSINKRSRDAKRKSDLEQVRSALEMYRVDKGSYPAGSTTGFRLLTDLDSSLVPDYMPSIPPDPQSPTKAYYYSPLGAGPNYYSYCVCANAETGSGDTCNLPVANSNCNYYLKNP
jgi:general secretion pathway protein G